MERVENEQLRLLRRANHELEHFFAHSSPDVVGTQAEIEALMQVERVLRAVGVTLEDSLKNSTSNELRDEVAIYRKSLLRLQRELRGMQLSAAGSRARLFLRQKHLDAAKAWCDTARAVR